MKREKGSSVKKLYLTLSIITILLISVAVIFGKNLIESQTTFEKAKVIERFPTEKQLFDPNILIQNIFREATEGRIPKVPFTAGEARLDDVLTEWGEPEKETPSGDGKYIDYPTKLVTFGHTNHTIFDVRSFSKDLHLIHFEDITQSLGKPSEQRYYKDSQIDQIILVYELNDAYQLKWILPRPTKKNPNPVVHHISVYTDPSKLKVDYESFLATMSLDEKIGQMIMAGVEGTIPTKQTTNLIEDYKVGGVIFFSKNFTSYRQSIDLVNGIKRINSINKIPLLLSVDQEGGRVTRLPGLEKLPTNKDIGLQNNVELSSQIGTILAQELEAYGLNMNYAPVVDVNSNPKNPVIGDRSFGDNPALVSKLGIQTMKAMQDEHIIPVIKHFPGHGDTEADSHLELPRIDKSLKELHEIELVPFIDAIEEGADVVMVAHILFDKLDSKYPSSMSKPIITDLLRKELNFDGVVITDDMMMKAIAGNYGIGEAAVQSVKAGSDIILISGEYEDIVSTIKALKSAVENGEISNERIDDSVKRILSLKDKYDINHHQIEYQDIQKINDQIKDVVK